MAEATTREIIVRREDDWSDDMFMMMMMPMMMMLVMVMVLPAILRSIAPDVPTGIAQMTVKATSEVGRIYLSPPWISFTVTNYGPDPLLIDINDDSFSPGERPIPKDATVNFEMGGKAVIEWLALKADGAEATAAFFANRR